MFPSTSSREIETQENKTHYFPLEHTLSVYCYGEESEVKGNENGACDNDNC